MMNQFEICIRGHTHMTSLIERGGGVHKIVTLGDARGGGIEKSDVTKILMKNFT